MQYITACLVRLWFLLHRYPWNLLVARVVVDWWERGIIWIAHLLYTLLGFFFIFENLWLKIIFLRLDASMHFSIFK